MKVRGGSEKALVPSSFRDSTDMALVLKLRESVDWDRILRSPRGESSLRVLQRETLENNGSQMR